MTSHIHARAKEIFHEAADQPPEERVTHLQEACRGDADLLREVETLLEHHDPKSVGEREEAPSRPSSPQPLRPSRHTPSLGMETRPFYVPLQPWTLVALGSRSPI